MTKLNIHGWENLSGDNPEAASARNELMKQLAYVPEPCRSAWEKRLKSKLDHPHFSVRLEVYLHQFFRERGWKIEIEPGLSGTSNQPDFVVHKGHNGMMVEAKTVLGAESERQQDSRLLQLMDDLSGKLNRTVLIHPMLDLPSSLPNRRIAADIESTASETELLQEFVVEGEHQGQPYSLAVTAILEDKPTPTADVGATVGQAVNVDIGHPVRKAIQDKASKYGEPHIPFVIAIWPQFPYHFSSKDDLVALYGDETWVVYGFENVGVSCKPNGVFTLKRQDDSYRSSHVSAVLFCRPDTANPPKLYHNPFAKRPVDMDVFEGIQQCTIDLATRRERWSYQ